MYKGSLADHTCKIEIPANEVHHLDAPLKVQKSILKFVNFFVQIFGKQGATILHIKV